MNSPCASYFICTFNKEGTRTVQASCCYATQPPKAGGLPGVELFNGRIGKKLTEWGIDLNGAENGVWLPSRDYPGRTATIHRGRTHGDYNKEILRRLGKATSREQALGILSEIRQELLNGELPINGAK